MAEKDPRGRFTDRVSSYVAHRPDYPEAVVKTLVTEAGLSPLHVVADIGSGTGIFARHLLQNGNNVYCVEPNEAMRSAAEQMLSDFEGFVSIAGSAEETGLADRSVDWIVAAQAFHWFDREASKAAFRRILRRDGQVALMWNERLIDTPFLRDYEELLHTHGTDYATVDHRNTDNHTVLSTFFTTYETRSFPNEQRLDRDGLIGRVESTSYTPEVGSEGHAALVAELHRLFDTHAVNGHVRFGYRTKLYWGSI